MYEIDIIMDNMVQDCQKNYIGMAEIRGRIILKDVIYSVFLASETGVMLCSSRIIHKYTVISVT